jgi:hypothetical protein
VGSAPCLIEGPPACQNTGGVERRSREMEPSSVSSVAQAGVHMSPLRAAVGARPSKLQFLHVGMHKDAARERRICC